MFKKIMIFCVLIPLIVGFTPQKQGDDVENPMGDQFAFSKNFQDKLSHSVALFVGSSDALVNNIDKKIEEDAQRVVPYIKQGRTLVPLRFIAEAFGATVNWVPDSRMVKMTMDDKTISLIIDEKNMGIKDKDIEREILLEVAAEIYENRTFVPLRQLVEALGKNVFWLDGLIIISDQQNFDEKQESEDLTNLVQKLNHLPYVGSIKNLKNIFQDIVEKEERFDNMFDFENSSEPIASERAADAEINESSSEVTSFSANVSKSAQSFEYSKTNIQVEGVDEADIVKTDGEYIYTVKNDEIIIAKAYPAEKMEVVHRMDVTEDGKVNAQPLEIYVDQNQLIVISFVQYPAMEKLALDLQEDQEEEQEEQDDIVALDLQEDRMMPFYPMKNYTKVAVYDIQDKKNPVALKNFEIEGMYLSSRKINTDFYFVTQQFLDVYNVLDTTDEISKDEYSVEFRDSAVSDKYQTVNLEDIRYFPKSIQSNYLSVVGMDLTSPDTPANVSTFLGAGQNIYATDRSLYIAVTDVEVSDSPVWSISTIEKWIEPILPPQQSTLNTRIYQFALNNGNITFMNEGWVPGLILNQFSMDEWQNHFRIATTVENFTGRNFEESNQLYVLDDTLKRVGEIENIAPGESIYSVRFMGDRAYMVTFETVDPLFVIDLKTPEKPEILGQLKIPGFSNYLHPYDENHVLGFGKDTTEYEQTVIEKGLKIALFDVSDVKNPVEKFVEYIGDRGTQSEVLDNHRALLFSKERDLLAFPVSLYTIQPQKRQRVDNIWQYGTFEYQGLYVYQFNLEDGFQLRGRITHLSDEEREKISTISMLDDEVWEAPDEMDDIDTLEVEPIEVEPIEVEKLLDRNSIEDDIDTLEVEPIEGSTEGGGVEVLTEPWTEPLTEPGFEPVVDPRSGFELVTPSRVPDIENDDEVWDVYHYPYGKDVERALYIEDVLYTISDDKIKANDLESLNEINELDMNE